MHILSELLLLVGPLVLLGLLGLGLVSLVRRRATPDVPGANPAFGLPQVITLPRPNPLERHRIDPIAFVAGLLTIAVGAVGLAHQLGAFELGASAVAILLAALVGLAIVTTIIVWPRTPQVIEDPRLERDAAKAAGPRPRADADERN